MADDDYIAINRANWDSRVPHHERGYSLDRFRSDPGHLSEVVPASPDRAPASRACP